MQFRDKLAAGALLVGTSFAALADEVDPFTTSIATITTKVETYGAALVVLATVGLVFSVGIKYVKKIRGAA